MIPYYPKIEVDIKQINYPNDSNAYSLIKLRTIVRKEYNGTWYMWMIYQDFNIRNPTEVQVAEVINNLMFRVHREAYFATICGIVDESNCKRLPVDEIQISEKERVEDLIKNK